MQTKQKLSHGVVSDPIADMLTRIRNASRARKAEAIMPCSKLKLEVARVLKDEGYIQEFEVDENGVGGSRVLRVVFKQRADRRQVITGLRRVSRPGLRVYAAKSEIPRVLGGLGIVVMSTSRGVMTGRQALQAGIGGEVLCYVW